MAALGVGAKEIILEKKRKRKRENLLASGCLQQMEACIQSSPNNAEFCLCQLIQLPRGHHHWSAAAVAVVR